MNISGDGGPNDPGPAINVAEVQHFCDSTELDIAYCIDGGACPVANHLTIVDCTTKEPKIVRTSVIHNRAIAAIL